MKKIPVQYDTEYEMSDYIPLEKTKFIYVSEEIVEGFKKMMNKYEKYHKVLEELDSLERAKIMISGKLDNIVIEALFEKEKDLEKTKRYYETMRDNAMDMSKFSFSNTEGRAIYEMIVTMLRYKEERGKTVFRDIFGANSEIKDIVQTVEMGQGMGIRADCNEYEIHIVNKSKGIEAIILYIR